MCIKFRNEYKLSHFVEIIHTETTLFCENYVNRLCKNLTALSDGHLMVTHARTLLPFELHKKTLSLIPGQGGGSPPQSIPGSSRGIADRL